MSNLGNIDAIAGKQFNMAVANTYGVNVMTSYGLPEATFIIASPTYNGVDTDTPTLFVSDTNGNPCRLTYAIRTGNGLSTNGDFISLNIDNKTIINKDGELDVELKNIIDEKTINIGISGKIGVNTQLLEKTSNVKYGVYKIDGFTIQTVNDVAMVETDTLSKSMSDTPGVVTSDNKTINIVDGVMEAITKNLEKADEYNYGVAMVDGTTLISNNGLLHVDTEYLVKSDNKRYGVVRIADKTITNKNGILSVNTDALSIADKEYGIVKTDNKSIDSKDGVISIRDYETLRKNVQTIKNMSETLEKNLQELNDIINNYSIESSKTPTINFNCNHVTSAVLTRPVPGTTPDKLASEKITAEFTINTNCPFYVSVTYDDNVSPGVFLYQMDYDRTDVYDGNTGIGKVMQSTNNEDKTIKFAFFCKNYAIENSHEYSTHTKIHITINYIHNNMVGESIDFNIVRFNTMYGVDNASELMKKYYRIEHEQIDIDTKFEVSEDGKNNWSDTLTLDKKHLAIKNLNNTTYYNFSNINGKIYTTATAYYNIIANDTDVDANDIHISYSSSDNNIIVTTDTDTKKLTIKYNGPLYIIENE